MNYNTEKQKTGAWLRFVEKGPLRIQVEAWYNRQQDKQSGLVRKILDLTHWDLFLDFYTIEHLLTRYPEPREADVEAALIECGYPPKHAEQRAKIPITDNQGLFEMGGRYQHKSVNPLHKYAQAYRVRI